MDDVPEFYSGRSMRAMRSWFNSIAQIASMTLVSSVELYSILRDQSKSIELVANACASNRLPPIPNRLPDSRRPIIGYVGAIASWFDWEILIEMARAMPHAIFRLIGPVFADIPSLPSNVKMEGELPHSLALQAICDFDVGLIPFKTNPLTRSVDPIKYYEYRALGRTVVSTPFGEMRKRSSEHGVFIAEKGSDFRQLLENALGGITPLENTRLFKDQNSWSARFDRVSLFEEFDRLKIS